MIELTRFYEHSLNKLLLAITGLKGCINPFLHGHNFRVALISLFIGSKLNNSNEFLRNLLIAGLLHDIGIMFLDEGETMNLLKDESLAGESIHMHAYIGFNLLKDYPSLSKAAEIIKYHHRSYREFLESQGRIPLSSQIIHLAGRIDIFMITELEKGKELFDAAKLLREKLLAGRGTALHPELVDLFLDQFYDKEFFYFELYGKPNYVENSILGWSNRFSFSISNKEFLSLIKLFGYIIDFKSPFTATHSSGVAETAAQISKYLHFSPADVERMRIAGFLHDIGKIFVPKDILNKKGRLTEHEFNIVKSHVFHTYKILSRFVDDREIVEWASYHHERLDGSGYPFKLKANQIPLGSRIMAVADVFTALTEERPYKKPSSVKDVLNVLSKLSDEGKLDPIVVLTLKNHANSIAKASQISQRKAGKTFNELRKIDKNFSCSSTSKII